MWHFLCIWRVLRRQCRTQTIFTGRRRPTITHRWLLCAQRKAPLRDSSFNSIIIYIFLSASWRKYREEATVAITRVWFFLKFYLVKSLHTLYVSYAIRTVYCVIFVTFKRGTTLFTLKSTFLTNVVWYYFGPHSSKGDRLELTVNTFVRNIQMYRFLLLVFHKGY